MRSTSRGMLRYHLSLTTPPVSPADYEKRFYYQALPLFLLSWTPSPGPLATPFASASFPSAERPPVRALPSLLQALALVFVFLPQTQLPCSVGHPPAFAEAPPLLMVPLQSPLPGSLSLTWFCIPHRNASLTRTYTAT